MRQQAMRVARVLCAATITLTVSVSAFGQSPSAFGQSPQPVAGLVPAQAPPTSQGPVRQLTVDDAVRLALEQNLSILVERLNPQIQDLAIAEARSAWTPIFSSAVSTTSTDSPVNSFLSGGQTKVSDDRVATSLAVDQRLPWGATYTFGWDSSRATTNNLFSNFDPVLRSSFNFQYVQPLLRDFRIDGPRQQLMTSRNFREVADIELRQTILQIVRNVKSAYWDLSYAVASLGVQRQSLDLARELLRNNRTRVEIGTMAPIDIVEAEAEVAQREEAVILAEAAISQAEDRLRSFIFDPATPQFWNIRVELTDAPQTDVRPIDIDAAVRNALDKRTDLLQARKNLQTNDINIRYFRNQTMPAVNAQLDYGLSGLGGTQFIRGEGFPGDIIGQTQRGFGSVLSDLFQNDFPNWTVSLIVGYPVGTSNAEANLARARLQYSQGQTQIRNLELQTTTQVRDVGRQVNTNLKRVQTTRSSRQLAERRLDAEEKKFAAGMSTSFFVFQAQRDLSLARNNELRAVLDYVKSLVDFETIQEVPLAVTAGGVSISAGSGVNAVTTPSAGVGTRVVAQQSRQ